MALAGRVEVRREAPKKAAEVPRKLDREIGDFDALKLRGARGAVVWIVNAVATLEDETGG
jgi:hypothetical protein